MLNVSWESSVGCCLECLWGLGLYVQFLDKSFHSTLPDLGLRFFCVGYFNCIFLNMQFKNCIFRSNLVLTFRKTSLKAKMMSWFCLVIYFNYALFFILEKSIAYLFIWKRSNEKWGWTREANGGTNGQLYKKGLDKNRVSSLDADFFSIPVTDVGTQNKYVLLKLDPGISVGVFRSRISALIESYVLCQDC